MSTITITFSESVENHVGNQQIGQKLNNGISVDQLYILKALFENNGFHCDYYDLSTLINNSENAGILVIKNYLDGETHLNLFNILSNLNWDKKAKMRGKVVNKHARHNLCFADFSQEPNYEHGEGRVYNFNTLNIMNNIRNDLVQYLNRININNTINAEGNYYYDVNKCYIGMHADLERRIVMGLRLGEQFPLYFRGYYNSDPISNILQINLEGGDLYIMSDKTVGYDARRRNIYVLKHAAGEFAIK